MDSNTKIRVLVADDHEYMCQSLSILIEKQDDMEVIGVADCGESAVKLARQLVPDVVVTDFSMGTMNGIDAARQIMSENPNTRILLISASLSSGIVSRAIKAGILGFMSKESMFSELICAIRAVHNNDKYTCSQITKLTDKNTSGKDPI